MRHWLLVDLGVLAVACGSWWVTRCMWLSGIASRSETEEKTRYVVPKCPVTLRITGAAVGFGVSPVARGSRRVSGCL